MKSIEISQIHDVVKWIAVRLDGLINEDTVTEYEIYQSPLEVLFLMQEKSV